MTKPNVIAALIRRLCGRENVILAKFKVETYLGFALFRDLASFGRFLGTVGVYLSPNHKDELPYTFRIWPGPTVSEDGYHFVEARGPKGKDFHWLLISVQTGDLSYHLTQYTNGSKAGT